MHYSAMCMFPAETNDDIAEFYEHKWKEVFFFLSF